MAVVAAAWRKSKRLKASSEKEQESQQEMLAAGTGEGKAEGTVGRDGNDSSSSSRQQLQAVVAACCPNLCWHFILACVPIESRPLLPFRYIEHVAAF